MFLLEEGANTSCNTISDSAMNYQVESCSDQTKGSVLSLCVFKHVFFLRKIGYTVYVFFFINLSVDTILQQDIEGKKQEIMVY